MKKLLAAISIIISTVAVLCYLVKFSKLDSLAFAWALNFLLMMSVAIFTDVLKSPLGASYYNQKAWECKGKIYEKLGVNVFRKLLVWIGWEKLLRKAFPIKNDSTALIKLHYQTKKSELDHLIILVIVLGFNVYVAVEFGLPKSMWLLILNILLNLYPIFLQRYNRPRIARIMKVAIASNKIKPTV